MVAGRPRPKPSSAELMDRLLSRSYRQAWDHSPAQIIITAGVEHVLVYQNHACRDLFGPLPLGRPITAVFPQLSHVATDRLTTVLRTGQIVQTEAHLMPMRDAHGDSLVMRYVMAPLGDPVQAVVTIALDVTDQAQTLRALHRTRLLADLSQAMSTAASSAAALQYLTDTLVRQIADLAAVYVMHDVADATDPATATLPPDVLSLSPALTPLGSPPPSARRAQAAPWEGALRGGQSLVIPVDETTRPALAPDAASRAWLQAAGLTTIAAVPLQVAGTLSAVLVLAATGERPPLDEDDLPFLGDVAARAAVAIGELRSARQHRDVALKLQRALLPAAPPALPGVSIVAHYIAGAPNVEVGGDWWEVHDLGDGRLGAGIGDVSGRGIAAAAVMGQVSSAMRALGNAHLPPAAVLRLLDTHLQQIITEDGGPLTPQFATACYSLVDRRAGTVTAASAGHLPLLVLTAGGEVHPWSPPTGAPLGLGVGGYQDGELPVAPGDTLVLFTDGLVESRDQDLDTGLGRLTQVLSAIPPTAALADAAQTVLTGMGLRPGAEPDDVALLMLRWDRPPNPR